MDYTRLRKLIREKGLSQRKVAESLGIAQPTLALKLQGKRPFYLAEALTLARFLEIEDGEFQKYFDESV